MTAILGGLCLLLGFILGVAAMKKAHKKQLQDLGSAIGDGYFHNTILSGLATILFHEHAENVFEVPVEGVIYKVFQRDKDILYEKKA